VRSLTESEQALTELAARFGLRRRIRAAIASAIAGRSRVRRTGGTMAKLRRRARLIHEVYKTRRGLPRSGRAADDDRTIDASLLIG